MSRSFPILLGTILVAGAIGADAHQSARSTASTVVSSSRLAYAGAPAAQADGVAEKVKAALKADPDLAGPSEGVTVTGAGGVVTLEGTVPTAQLRAKIGEASMKVDGVTKLNNKLKLAKK